MQEVEGGVLVISALESEAVLCLLSDMRRCFLPAPRWGACWPSSTCHGVGVAVLESSRTTSPFSAPSISLDAGTHPHHTSGFSADFGVLRTSWLANPEGFQIPESSSKWGGWVFTRKLQGKPGAGRGMKLEVTLNVGRLAGSHPLPGPWASFLYCKPAATPTP